RPGDLKKPEVRIDLRADAFKRHDRANDVSEARGNLEREFVDHVSHVKHQRLKGHIAEPYPKVAVEQVFDDRLEPHFVLRRQFNKAQANQVVDQPVNIALDDVEKSIDQVRLKLHIEPAHHAEVEKRQTPVGHHPKISGMRIGVKEPVFEKLFEVSSGEQRYYIVRVVPGGGEPFGVDDFLAVDEFHHDHAAGRKYPVDLRNVNFLPAREVRPECFGISRFLLVIHLFVDRRVKRVERTLPIHAAHQVRVTLEPAGDATQHVYVELDLIVNPRPLNFDCDYLTRSQSRAMNLSETRRRDRRVFE